MGRRHLESPGTVYSGLPIQRKVGITREQFQQTGAREIYFMTYTDSYGGTEREITLRVAEMGYFGWSVVEDRPGWYGAVITSLRSKHACARYIADLIKRNRLFHGYDISVEDYA